MATPRRPPALATTVLKRFGPPNGALAGDLREAFAEGKSTWWYWGQVLSAIVGEIIDDGARRPAPTIVVVIAAAVFAWWVTQFVSMILGLDQWLFETGLNRWFYLTGHGLPLALKGFPALAVWKALAYTSASFVAAKIDARSARLFTLGIIVANAVQFVDLCVTPNAYSLTQLVVDLLVLYPVATICGAILGADYGNRIAARN